MLVACGLGYANASTPKPVLISAPASTRAVALEAVAFTPEPFSPKGVSGLYTSGQSTRIILFALNLSLQPNEGASAVTADAEDATHRRYELKVEHVGKVSGQEWLTAVILQLDPNMDDPGDVLIQIKYQGLSSNRVRVGIGHIGGGPVDDPGAGPTPAPPYRLTGRITMDNSPFEGVAVNLAGPSTAAVTTNADGTFSFNLTSAGTYSIIPVKKYFRFTPVDVFLDIANSHTINFTAVLGYFVIDGVVKDEHGQGLDGISVTRWSSPGGPPPFSVPTSGGGKFRFTDLAPGFNYSLVLIDTPFHSFTSQTTTDLSENRTLTFQGTRRTYAIRGTIRDKYSRTVSGFPVTLSGATSGSTMTNSNGDYSFPNLVSGRSYTVSAAKQNFAVTPVSIDVPNLTDNSDANFSAIRDTVVVNGTIKDSDGTPVDGLVVKLDSNSPEAPPRTALTSGGGNFSFPDVPTLLDYVVSPQNTSLNAFTPQSFAALNANLALTFNGTLRSYAISGTIRNQAQLGVAGVAVTLSGGATGSTTTDQNGEYSFTNLNAGRSYTVAAAKADHFVDPGAQTLTLFQDESANFNAIRFYIINGRVTDGSGKGLDRILMSLTGPQNAQIRTASDGSYSFTVTAFGDYALTPSREQDFYQFSPAVKSFPNLSDHQIVNFSGAIVIIGPTHVLEFDGTPMAVDYGVYWPSNTNVGQFFWELWAMPGADGYARYMLSDGYGGAHAVLFGFNTGQPGRYSLMGNVWIGTDVFYFNSDDGPSPGEWGHYAVGWDGSSIITYYDGVPVGKQMFTGPRVSTGTYNGATLLFVGGSNHQNFIGRIAQIRGFEENNPRANSPESAFTPETVFSAQGQLLSYYFNPGPVMADLSDGYIGSLHNGWPRSMHNYFEGCPDCPKPKFVLDPSAPDFSNADNPGQTTTQVAAPATPPTGALVFDSFSRNNSTYILNDKGGLGTTETGSATWQTNVDLPQPQPFGILSGRAVVLANTMALAWVPVTTSTGDLDISVGRFHGLFGSGAHTGLCFRVIDKDSFFFAYSSDDPANPSGPKRLIVGYFQFGVKTILADNIAMPADWTLLRVITRGSGDISISTDGGLLYSTSNLLNAFATGSGLFNHGAGMGLQNRWDNFTVRDAP